MFLLLLGCLRGTGVVEEVGKGECYYEGCLGSSGDGRIDG